MRKGNLEEAKRWIDTAKRDLLSAEHSVASGDYPVAFFWAHQSSEKALKAFLYYMNESEVKGHSTHDLSACASKYDKSFLQILPTINGLDLGYITTRYPDSIPGGTPYDLYDEKSAREAIRCAQEVIDFVVSKLDFGDSGK
jgi:HEPN domain-containing protein